MSFFPGFFSQALKVHAYYCSLTHDQKLKYFSSETIFKKHKFLLHSKNIDSLFKTSSLKSPQYYEGRTTHCMIMNDTKCKTEISMLFKNKQLTEMQKFYSILIWQARN